MEADLRMFTGFYYSTHELNFDNAIDQLFDYEEAPEEFWSLLDVRPIYIAYAKRYVEALAEVLEENDITLPSLRFSELASPREYNFTTDRIFVTLNFSDVMYLWKKVDKAFLAQSIKETFTSRPGLHSFYSSEFSEWAEKPLKDWDLNEVGTLLQAVIEKDISEEDLTALGDVSELVYDNLSPECQRIVDIFVPED